MKEILRIRVESTKGHHIEPKDIDKIIAKVKRMKSKDTSTVVTGSDATEDFTVSWSVDRGE